jgi:hypothetical protein
LTGDTRSCRELRFEQSMHTLYLSFQSGPQPKTAKN